MHFAIATVGAGARSTEFGVTGMRISPIAFVGGIGMIVVALAFSATRW